MESYLDDYNEPISTRRRSTELSRFAERLAAAFMASGASTARVRHEQTEYTCERLYKGLYNVSQKKRFKGALLVHKQDGDIVLIRRKRN